MTGPADEVTFIPAPVLVVKRLADGSEMGRFPATSHQLADKIARRWRGSVTMLPVESRAPRSDIAGSEGPQ